MGDAAPRATSLEEGKERLHEVMGGMQDFVLTALQFIGSVTLSSNFMSQPWLPHS